MKSAKVFHEIAILILESCSYNRQKRCIDIDTENIKSVLSHVNQSTVSRIINIAERIALDQSLKIERSESNLQCNDLKKTLYSLVSTILEFDPFESVKLHEAALIEQINSNYINDKDLTLKIRDSVNNAFGLLMDSSLDQDNTPLILSNLKITHEQLKCYKENMKVSDWLEEIIVRQVKNKAVIEQNLQCIEELKGKASIIAVYEEEVGNFVQNADDLREVINQNSNLLSRIEREIQEQLSKVEKFIVSFEAFQLSIADGIIVKLLEDDNILSYKLQPLSNALSSEFNDQIENLTPYSFKAELKQINLLEVLIGSKSSLGNNLRDIDKKLTDLKHCLVLYQNEILYPIPEEIFIYERSTWDNWKASLASFSEFFIGHDNHVKIYGLPDPIEELRRLADDNPEIWFNSEQICIEG